MVLWDEIIRRVLRYGRTALLVDESVGLADTARIVPAYRRAIVTGRELYVPVISCTQRPTAVHNVVLSEAEHYFVFDLQLDGASAVPHPARQPAGARFGVHEGPEADPLHDPPRADSTSLDRGGLRCHARQRAARLRHPQR